MRRAALLLTLVSLLLLPMSARADVFKYQDVMTRVIEHTFVPLCSPVTVRLGTDAEMAAEHEPAGFADLASCTIAINPHALIYTSGLQCSLLAHELGHLAGLGHSTDPNDLMAPTMSGLIWPPCQPFDGIENDESKIPVLEAQVHLLRVSVDKHKPLCKAGSQRQCFILGDRRFSLREARYMLGDLRRDRLIALRILSTL